MQKQVKLIAEVVEKDGVGVLLRYRGCKSYINNDLDVLNIERKGDLYEVTVKAPWYFNVQVLSPDNEIPFEELVYGLEVYLEGTTRCYLEDVEVPFVRYLALSPRLILVEDIHGNLYLWFKHRYYKSPYWERFRASLQPYPEAVKARKCGHYYKLDLGDLVKRVGNYYVFKTWDGRIVKAWKDPIIPHRFCLL